MAKKPTEPPEVLTTPEACRFLRIDKRTYYSLVESEQINARRLGRGYKVLRSTLVEFLKAGPAGRRPQAQKS